MPSWRLGTAENLKLYFHTTPHLIVKEDFICTSSRQVYFFKERCFLLFCSPPMLLLPNVFCYRALNFRKGK
jgi:hypothetical protein